MYAARPRPDRARPWRLGWGLLSRLAVTSGEKRRRRRRDGGRPRALILVPTRELAAQVEEVLGPLAAAIGAAVTSVYGGVGYDKQLAALRRGVDVLIACPGRLEDLVARGSVDLGFVEMVVIDEADRMADMGFLPAVRRLVDRHEPKPPDAAVLGHPGRRRSTSWCGTTSVRRCATRWRSADTNQGEVHHRFWSLQAEDRVAVTAETVAARGPALVFCRTKRGADRLSQRLARFGPVHGRHPRRPQSRPEGTSLGRFSGWTARRSGGHRRRGAGHPRRRTCRSWSTTIRPPMSPTTCTAPVAPAGPGLTASSSAWLGRITSSGPGDCSDS